MLYVCLLVASFNRFSSLHSTKLDHHHLHVLASLAWQCRQVADNRPMDESHAGFFAYVMRLLKMDAADSLKLTPLLPAKAVLLRLEAGSEEANYLAAICPIPKVPTLVVIK